MKILIAWSVFAVLIYGGISAASAWKNPWTVERAAVMDMLPPAAAGCGADCK